MQRNRKIQRGLKMKSLIAIFGFVVALSVETASAQWTFQATLNGAGEFPANGSTGTGFGTVILNAAQTQITVNESWSGITTPATASHIHGPAGFGTNAPIIFGFTNVPPAISGSIPLQTFTINPTQVSYLFGGLLYMNVHDATFPGGEIRGQLLLVPEPSTLALVGLGSGAIAFRAYRKRTKRLQG
jgi:hypothetical protein